MAGFGPAGYHRIGSANFKRSAVFKVCKAYPKPVIERCLNDTKELSQSGQAWRYFFKLIDLEAKKPSV